MSYETLLRPEEKIILDLRALYTARGCSPYRMGKFEEYDLYARHKEFLISDAVLTFTGSGGRLMALRPDVTLSIVRSYREEQGLRKLCYNENVYRADEAGDFRELTQTGLECLGPVGEEELAEVTLLAMESLDAVAADWRLSISHLGALSALLDRLGTGPELRRAALECVSRRSAHELRRLFAGREADPAVLEGLLGLLELEGPVEEILPGLEALGCRESAAALGRVAAAAAEAGFARRLIADFSIVGNLNYYNGLVFQGYVQGVPAAVLSGGQYDRMLRRMGRRGGAIGFAVYVDRLTEFAGPGGEGA